MTTKENSKVVTVNANLRLGEKQQELSYVENKTIGSGSFGTVFQARLLPTDEIVAIKKVLQDRRFKNRELQIMRLLSHQNIVQLKYFFHWQGDRKEDVFLNLVLEYIPETVYQIARSSSRQKHTMPLFNVKLFRSLSYIHNKGICHRDIKPQNLLLDPATGVLKLCDFGSAKVLTRGEPNVSYICSRYYRAPELIFGAVEYTCQIDIWSAGCVLAELMLGQPIFPGDSGVDQLVEIIKVLGTPTRAQILKMNPEYQEFKFPVIKAHPWHKVFRSGLPQEAIQLVSKLLDYTPSDRLTSMDAMAHEFFDELRQPNCVMPNAKPLPPLFNFTEEERTYRPDLMSRLIPDHEENTETIKVKPESKEEDTKPAEAVKEDRANVTPQTASELTPTVQTET